MRNALALSLLLACNASAPPSPAPAPVPPTAAAAPPAVAAPPAGPLELKVVAHAPTHLSDGTEIEVLSAGYAHRKDDRNMQNCRVEVRRGAERATLSLERDDAPAPQVALGWRFELETVAAYNPPTTCVLTVERAP
ncbi:hypothetical protein [Nannocystis pusilla]|uniref:hypothetical protein n=1 Tax=Nannocystis pusilla TaxID=889268 RepID=UPI003BEF51BF